MAPWQGIDDHYVFLNSGPLFHIGTFMPNLSTFVTGGANVFVARSDGEALCRVDRGRSAARAGFVVGPMVDAIVEANADGRLRPLDVPRARAATPPSTRWCSRTDRPGAATPAATARPR